MAYSTWKTLMESGSKNNTQKYWFQMKQNGILEGVVNEHWVVKWVVKPRSDITV